MKSMKLILSAILLFCLSLIVSISYAEPPLEKGQNEHLAIAKEVKNKIFICSSASTIGITITEIGEFNEQFKYWPVKTEPIGCYTEGPPSSYIELSNDVIDYFKLYKDNKGNWKAEAVMKMGKDQ